MKIVAHFGRVILLASLVTGVVDVVADFVTKDTDENAWIKIFVCAPIISSKNNSRIIPPPKYSISVI